MAKRFTDTTKWKRPWFRQLGAHAKLLWLYLCDECDHAGIFIADFDLISFQVGFKVDEEKLAHLLGDKLVQLAPDKYFVPSYLGFQYGEKDNRFRAKESALRTLAQYDLVDESGNLKDLTNSYLTVTKDLPKSIGISINKSICIKKGGVGENKILDIGEVSLQDLESAYQLYPRKEGKSDGMKIARAQIKTRKDLADLNLAILRYKEKLKADGTDRKYIKHFGTFMAKWRDCLDPEYGTSENFSQTSKPIEEMDFSHLEFDPPEAS